MNKTVLDNWIRNIFLKVNHLVQSENYIKKSLTTISKLQNKKKTIVVAKIVHFFSLVTVFNVENNSLMVPCSLSMVLCLENLFFSATTIIKMCDDVSAFDK